MNPCLCRNEWGYNFSPVHTIAGYEKDSAMKDKLTDELKDIYAEGKNWLELEVKYAKLTVAEKFTTLLSALVIGAICLLLGIVALIFLSFALVRVFESLMPGWLSFICVAGIMIIIMILLFIFKKHILVDPIARFISRLFFDK